MEWPWKKKKKNIPLESMIFTFIVKNDRKGVTNAEIKSHFEKKGFSNKRIDSAIDNLYRKCKIHTIPRGTSNLERWYTI